MELRAPRFAVAAAVLLAGALFGILLPISFQSPRPTAPSEASAPPAPATPDFVLTQLVRDGPIVVATQTPAGGLVVITQFPLPQVRQARPTQVGREFRYDAVRPRDIPDILELRGRGYYDLIDFRYKPEISPKEQP